MSRFFFFIGIIILPFIIQAQTRLHNITVKGKVSDINKGAVSMAGIDIVEGSKTVKKVIANSSGNYDLVLEKGLVYTFVFQKFGYVSKRIEVSTEEIGEDELKYGIFPLILDVNLFESFPGLNTSSLNKPVAKLKYSDYEGDYVYDEEYSAVMNKEVDKVITAQKKIKKEAYDNLISTADMLYEDKWYEESILEYKNALLLFPNEKYPKTQVDKIRQILQKSEGIEKSYTAHVKNGDKNFNKKNYKISKSYYQKSLIYKPEEEYPKNRIDDIEKILAGNPELQNKNESDAAEILTANNSQTEQNQENVNDENKSSDNQTTETKKEPVSDVYKKNSGISQISSQSSSVDKKLDDNQKNEYLNNLLDKYNKSGDSVNAARVHIAMGIDAYNNQKYEDAAEHFRISYEQFSEAGMNEEQAAVAESMADIYFSMYRYSASADWYARARGLYNESGNTKKASDALLKSADASYQAGDMDQALSKYLSASIESGQETDLSSMYNSIGVIHFEMENYDEALKYYDMSISSAETKGNVKEMAMSLNNIGNVKYEGEDYNSALQYYNRSVMAKNRIEYKEGIAVSLHNIANVYRKTGDYKKALEYYSKSEKFALASGNTDVIYENYGALADIYSKMKDCGKALQYYKLYSETRHLIARKQGKDQINESSPYYANMLDKGSDLDILRDEMRKQRLLAFYESSRKQKEIEYLNLQNQLNEQRLQNNENQIKTQRLLIIAAGAGLLLLLLFMFSLFRQIRQKKRANMLLAEQNEEINAQKHEIESQRDLLIDQKEKIERIHLELTDSIRYAQRIQNAVLSSVKILTDHFPETFILYKPLEIVSGDFYWSVLSGNKLVFCVADCTGHGVPGAFMSMLGISFLNEIVLNENQTQPDIILNYLRDSTIQALGQKENTDRYGTNRIRDGMDIALCTINLDTLELQFAGANNPLYIVTGYSSLVTGDANQQPATSNQELIELKGDKMPIGVYERMDNFTLKTYQLSKGDILFMFSDGYVDQFGGPNGKKFKNKALKELFLSNCMHPMSEQQQIIAKTHDEWKGKMHQIDDVTLLGIKIS